LSAATAIERDPRKASREEYDVIVVGGGIHGVCLAWEASRRGLRPLLLERADFGGATTWNSLRIVHGGLRYLQSLDLRRYWASVAERRFFLANFPDLVVPLPCLIPLHGEGLYRPSVFGLALLADLVLSPRRNAGVRRESRIGAGRILGREAVIESFPAVDRRGLKGGALWVDAAMPDSERLVMEILRWACANGATALNYVWAVALLREGTRTRGVVARDEETGATFEFRGRVVINCAGPWCREVAAAFDRDEPRLFSPSIAFNLFLDRPPLSASAVAIPPRGGLERTYFAVPWEGKVLAGTYHAAWPRAAEAASPPRDLILRFLAELNRGIPGLALEERDVLRTHAGLLPARRPGDARMASRDVIVDHSRHGGPAGLVSMSGIKATTARRLAERALGTAFTRLPAPDRDAGRPAAREILALGDLEALAERDPAAASAWLRRLASEESVVHIDDLILRRTGWGRDPGIALDAAARACERLGWPPDRTAREIERARNVLSPPGLAGPATSARGT
jgi:glycerol-3-phosphate dehydrogenase